MGLKGINYKLTISGKTINDNYIKSITFKDEIDDKSDEITVNTIDEFPRPNFGEEVVFYLGTEGLNLMGKFYIQSTTISNQKLSFRATGADWTTSTKTKKNRKWENIDIKGIVSKIANESGWSSKCDVDHFYKHLSQSHESDLHMLKRLSKDLDATLSVKNKTLLFLDKETAKPTYNCNISEAISYSIELVNKTMYKSAKLVYRDTKQGKDVEVKVGSGEPLLEIKKPTGEFSKNPTFAKEKAKTFAEKKLKNANRGTVRGRVQIVGDTAPKAGGYIQISGTKYDDGVYKIKSVTHNLSNSGWKTDIEFEK